MNDAKAMLQIHNFGLPRRFFFFFWSVGGLFFVFALELYTYSTQIGNLDTVKKPTKCFVVYFEGK